MNQLTPGNKKFNHNLNNTETPLGMNKFNTSNRVQNLDETKKFKTISHLKQYNNLGNANLNQVSQKLFDDNLLNKTESNIREKKVEKINYKLKLKSMPKNRKNNILEENHENNNNNKNYILSKSSNNIEKLKQEQKLENIIKEMKIDSDEKKNDEDSENLSALAEDLLSLSDEYNVELMRKGPINKNDFFGESKEFYNMYKNKENKLTNINENIINLAEIKTMPKLKTKLYSSPLDKFNIKNMNNLYNNNKNSIKKNNNNFHNFKLDDMYNTYNVQQQLQIIDNKEFQPKVNNHISSNSMQNNLNNNNENNSNIINNNINKNTILNNIIKKSQAVKNTQTNNNHYRSNIDNIFNKTALNQNNKNDFMDFGIDNTKDVSNNRSVEKKRKNINWNNNNNSNSNRNIKKNINVKKINSLGIQKNMNSTNEYLGKNYLKINYKNNQVLYTKNNNINSNNMKNFDNKNNFYNSNDYQNINLINNTPKYYSNNNYTNNDKYSINNQKLKKTQTFNFPNPNDAMNINNFDYINKNLNNINMNQNNGLNPNILNMNAYNGLNDNDFVQSLKKNYQSNKVLRKSDYQKQKNKKNILNIADLENDKISNNFNLQSPVDRNSLLVKGKNKNSYKNIYNYMNINLNMNEAKIKNNNIYINNKDMISNTRKVNNLNTKNLAYGYKNENIYTYQGQNDNFDYLNKNNYLNKRLELEAY